MASDEAIKKMIQAIMDKRKELGILDWGLVPIEEVLNRLNNSQEHTPDNPPSENDLADNAEDQQNNGTEQTDENEPVELPSLINRMRNPSKREKK